MNDFVDPESLIYRRSVEMVSFISNNAPALWASNISEIAYPSSNNFLNHHLYLVRTIKAREDAVGIEDVYNYGTGKDKFREFSGEIMIAFCVPK